MAIDMFIPDKAAKLWIRMRTWIPFLIFQKGSVSYTKRWLNSVIHRRSAFEDAIPWLHFFAIDWLENYVDSSMKVFEWGSGGSTLFWSRHVQHVICVEHDRAWYERVLQTLERDGIKNVKLLHVPGGREKVDTPEDLLFVGEGTREVFREYANWINDYPDEEFDIIVVDGMARLACLSNAIPKLRPGGVIVFDNSNRYEAVLSWFAIDDWTMLHFRGPNPYEPTGSFTVTTLLVNKTSDAHE
jgi:precorrin-6B methylase 2